MAKNEQSLSVIQPNAMTNARYDYTKIEKNIIYQVIIALQDTMAISQVTEDLFSDHLKIIIPYARLKKWDNNDNLSRNLKTAVSSLRKKDYDIKTNDGWIDTGFIVYARYVEGKHLEAHVSKGLLPALVQLTNNFTAYNAVVALSLRSKYAQRFYEWCCQWKNTGWFEFTPDTLNKVLMSKMTTGALNERVIQPAMTELSELYKSEQCDVCFTVEEERGGKGRGGGVKKWRFHVKSRLNEDKLREANQQDFIYIFDFLKKVWPGKQDLVSKAADRILTSNCVKKVADRFEKITLREVRNPGGYVRTLLADEFDIKV